MSEIGAAIRGLQSLEQQAHKLQTHDYKIVNLRRSCEKMGEVEPVQYVGRKDEIRSLVAQLVKSTQARAASYSNISAPSKNLEQKPQPGRTIQPGSLSAEIRTRSIHLIRQSLTRLSKWLR